MPGQEHDVTEDLREGPPPPLDGFAHLPVWLETGYDGGRIAGWVTDLPGVLAVADTRARALSLAITQAARVRAWLEAHGDDAGIPRIWRYREAGEIPARREADGHEVNATFPGDRRVVTHEEVVTAIRRLDWAREDLLDVADRVDAHEASRGPLPVNAARGERTPEAVLRHAAGSEVWLIGRLPGGGRYDGSLDGVPPRDALAGSRAWVRDRLRALVLADDGAETADRHGETWTLAKVLRRLQAHGLDHLWELERRLVRADGTGERVRVVLDRFPDTGAVVTLLRSVGWDLRASEPASLERALAGTIDFATAWDGDRLIGTARSITDGAQNAIIATVVVHPAYQGLGIGEQMMHLLTDGRDLVRFSLAATPGLESWYRKLGFLPDPHAMFRPRRRH
ncbi:MAG TPA: GNAT family N-acetyltransferase [Candidatus Limnocylindrales bacterium]|nr:GNAT family N-acetyltransferase [Candidatus Limnocylindrales bacterium]